MKRRQFLVASARAAAVATPFLTAPVLANPISKEENWTLSPADTDALVQLVDVLFPAGPGTPAASDLRAAQYIQLAIVDPDIDEDERRFLRKGFVRLNEFSREREHMVYGEVPRAKADAVLRAFVDDGDGASWVSAVLSYVLEALLGDPAYGINVGEVGWKWADHRPGYPRPPKAKWYRTLAKQ